MNLLIKKCKPTCMFEIGNINLMVILSIQLNQISKKKVVLVYTVLILYIKIEIYFIVVYAF